MKGFSHETNRSTKGGSLSRQRESQPFKKSVFRRLGRNTLPVNRTNRNGNAPTSVHVESSRNGALRSDGGVSAFFRKIILNLIASELPAWDDYAEDDYSESPEGARKGNGSAPAHLVDDLAQDLADDEFITIPRWKRILDVTCICLTFPIWLPVVVAVMAIHSDYLAGTDILSTAAGWISAEIVSCSSSFGPCTSMLKRAPTRNILPN